MRLWKAITALMGAGTMLLGLAFSASAHTPHVCPASFPDAPALAGHVEQNQIIGGQLSFQEIQRAGRLLFVTVFNRCDGQGRPATTGNDHHREPGQPAFTRISGPDSNACAGCHAQPRPGGGGDFVANVFVLAQILDPVTDSLSPQLSDERNTLGMFGAGPIEMVGREMTADLQTLRDAALEQARTSQSAVTIALESKGVHFGTLTAHPDGSLDTSAVQGVDADLVVKPFHQAGVVRSLRQFTVNAFDQHHGLQPEERFDRNPDKGFNPDYDQDGVTRELTVGDITAVTLFQAALGTPGRVLPVDPDRRRAVDQGEQLFDQMGCTACHLPHMVLHSALFVEPDGLNPAGTFSDTGQSYAFDMTKQGERPRLEPAPGGGAVVRAYTDLKRHDLCDAPERPDAIRFFCNEQLAQGRPDQEGRPGTEFFLTRKLWDVGNSAPYGHRGDLTTISEAILYHGGEARGSRDAFVTLSVREQAAIVQFLKTLQVLPSACPNLVISENHGCLYRSGS